MTSLPPEIIETLTKINTALKTLNKAVKDFSNISYDELLQVSFWNFFVRD